MHEQSWNTRCPEGFTAFQQDKFYVVNFPDVDADVFEDGTVYQNVQEVLQGRRGIQSRMVLTQRK